MATLCSDVDFSSWIVDPPARDGRLGLVRSTETRKLPIFQLTQLPVLSTPWGATSFGDDVAQTRLSIVLGDLPADVIDFFERLDAHFIRYVADHSQDLLKKTLSVEEVTAMWKPAVSARNGYPPQLKAKFNLAGNKPVKIWDLSGRELPISPGDLPERPLTCSLKATGYWQMSGREMGVVYDVQHVLCGEPVVPCPFSFGAAENEPDPLVNHATKANSEC